MQIIFRNRKMKGKQSNNIDICFSPNYNNQSQMQKSMVQELKSKMQRQRPLTTTKRVQKFSTQPSDLAYDGRTNFYGHTSSSDSPSNDNMILNLKRFRQQNICIKFKQRANKNNSTNFRTNPNSQLATIQAENTSNRIKDKQNNQTCEFILCHLNPDMFVGVPQKYKQNKSCGRLGYKRGLNVERIYYRNQILRITQMQKTLPQIDKLTPVQIFDYKQKYLDEYLHNFFALIKQECYEKSLYITKLWDIIRQIFEQLVKRLVKQMKSSQKKHLQQSLDTHQKYQQKFQQFKNLLTLKQEQINKYKQIISKISQKNRRKCRKNRQINHGIVKIVDKLSCVQKQRDELESEYINMLTLGYQGGMEYDEAKKFTISKFRIQKDMQPCETQKVRSNNFKKVSIVSRFINNEVQNQSKMCGDIQVDLVQRKKIRKSKKQRSATFTNQQQKMAKKIYKIKQKYIYGSNRLVIPDTQDDSDDQDMKSSIANARFYTKLRESLGKESQMYQDIINEQHCPKNFKISQFFETQGLKTYQNKKVQTCPFMSTEPKVQRQSTEVNYGVNQKYKDNQIRNKQTQTQIFRPKINQIKQFNCSSQYDQLDFTTNLLNVKTVGLSKRKSTKNKSELSSINTQIDFISDFKQDKTYEDKKLQINQIGRQIFIQKQKQVEVQQKEQKIQEQSFDQNKIIRKKDGQTKKNLGFKNNKKGNRPSIFKRASMISFNNSKILTNIPQLDAQLMKNENEQKTKLNNKGKANNLQKIRKFNSSCTQSSFYQNRKNSGQDNQLSMKQKQKLSDINKYKQIQSQTQEQQQQKQNQQDYFTTDMLSVMQNMSKLTPKGIYIDQTMLFLLRKSLFKIKHEDCDNVLQKNYNMIMKIRQQVSNLKSLRTNHSGTKNSIIATNTNISNKNIVKIIGTVYDTALVQLANLLKNQIISDNQLNQKNKVDLTNSSRVTGIQLRNLQKQENESGKLVKNHNKLSQSDKRKRGSQTSFNSFNLNNSQNNKKKKKQINLLQILRQNIRKQYPMCKPHEIQHKIIMMMKNVQYQKCSNYMIKNFLLLSCLDDNIFSPVIYSTDVLFYLEILVQLNINNDYKEKASRPYENRQKNYKISNSNGSYQNCFTSALKLKQILPIIIKKYYKKQSLLTFINKKVSDTLQKLQSASVENKTSFSLHTKLDIFKCSQLILESLFSYKLDILKSFAQITQIPQLSPNSLINQQILMDMLGFLRLTKLDILNTINKFRYSFGKVNTIHGINLINMVNFCISHDVMDFDQILYDVIKNHPIVTHKFFNTNTKDLDSSTEILKHIDNLTFYQKYNKMQKICKYLHRRNLEFLKGDVLKQKQNTIISIKGQGKDKKIEDVIMQNKIGLNLQAYSLTPIRQQKQNEQDLKNQISSEKSNKLDKQDDWNKQQSEQQLTNTQLNTHKNSFNDFSNLVKASKADNKKCRVQKQFWDIIGVSASKSLIHCKVVQLQSSELLQTILGQNLISLYMTTLCQLQQKKYSREKQSSSYSNQTQNYAYCDNIHNNKLNTVSRHSKVGKRCSVIQYTI